MKSWTSSSPFHYLKSNWAVIGSVCPNELGLNVASVCPVLKWFSLAHGGVCEIEAHPHSRCLSNVSTSSNDSVPFLSSGGFVTQSNAKRKWKVTACILVWPLIVFTWKLWNGFCVQRVLDNLLLEALTRPTASAGKISGGVCGIGTFNRSLFKVLI